MTTETPTMEQTALDILTESAKREYVVTIAHGQISACHAVFVTFKRTSRARTPLAVGHGFTATEAILNCAKFFNKYECKEAHNDRRT